VPADDGDDEIIAVAGLNVLAWGGTNADVTVTEQRRASAVAAARRAIMVVRICNSNEVSECCLLY